MARASVLAIVAATACLATTVSARADTCAALGERLASLDRGAEDFWNNGLRGTQAAIERQRAALARAVSEARKAGCQGGLLFKPSNPSGRCDVFVAAIEQIDESLQRLEARRDVFADDPYAAERQRSLIIREMATNGCSDRGAAQAGNRRRAGLFRSLFGGRRVFGDTERAGIHATGTYRTMCVRACDGYYFPISFRASPASFGRDEDACRARCPGTDVGLYVYRNPGEAAEQMVSLAGEPYAALPNAFRFRHAYDRACACPPVPAGETTPIATAGHPSLPARPVGTAGPVPMANDAPSGSIAAVPVPRPRDSGADDPETTANRAGGFAPLGGSPGPDQRSPTATGRDGRPIRVVGPPGPM